MVNDKILPGAGSARTSATVSVEKKHDQTVSKSLSSSLYYKAHKARSQN